GSSERIRRLQGADAIAGDAPTVVYCIFFGRTGARFKSSRNSRRTGNAMAFATTNADLSARGASSRPTLRARLQDLLPKLVLSPSFAIILVFVYGFILWTIYL